MSYEDREGLTETENDRFEQAFLEAVDDGLLTLGESGRKAIYFHLQSMCSLRREDIPNKPKEFMEGLRKIFGVGVQVLEKAIGKNLYAKLGLQYAEKKDHDFLACIDDARRMLEQKE
jgi:hypothetical protein